MVGKHSLTMHRPAENDERCEGRRGLPMATRVEVNTYLHPRLDPKKPKTPVRAAESPARLGDKEAPGPERDPCACLATVVFFSRENRGAAGQRVVLGEF